MSTTQPFTLDALIKGLQASGDLEKSASESTETLTTAAAGDTSTTLEELLTKSASEQSESTNEEISEMNKQAQDLGKDLANTILANLAEMTKQANTVIAQNDMIEAVQAQSVAPTPREGQTVTNTLQELLLRGVANGGATENLGEDHGPDEAAAQGAAIAKTPTAPAAAEGARPGADVSEAAIEKAAAVSELVGNGATFEDAVAMVKWAEEELAKEELEMAKLASVQALMSEGVSIADAVAAVEASAKNLGF